MFTHHFLQGLRGVADLDRDGKISIDELFDYTSRSVHRDTGQVPQQLILAKRKSVYAIAPAYQSRLRIGAQVVGHLRISIHNFVWSYHKLSRRPILLSTIDGQGRVLLRRQKRCWSQTVQVIKGRESQIDPKAWKKIRCQRFQAIEKGQWMLQGYPDRAQILLSEHFLSFGVGTGSFGDPSIRSLLAEWDVGWRWSFVDLGLRFSTGRPENKSFALSRVECFAGIGYPFVGLIGQIPWLGSMGVFVSFSLPWQFGEQIPTLVSWGLSSGVKTDLTFWFFKRWGLRLGALLGVDYTPVREVSGFSLRWGAHIAWVWRV